MHEQEKGLGQTEGTATAVLQGSEPLSAKDSQTGQEIAPEVKNGFSDFENQLAEDISQFINQLIPKAYKAHVDQLASSWKSESFEAKIESLSESFVELVVDRGETDPKEVAHRGATAILNGMRAAATGKPVAQNGEEKIDFELAREVEEITKTALIRS